MSNGTLPDRHVEQQEITHMLDSNISKEILEGLTQCRGDKAPMPDNFNIGFLQKFWGVVKGDIIYLFREFHESCYFVKGLNSLVLVIIPKIEGTMNIKDLRPILQTYCKSWSNSNGQGAGRVVGECQHPFCMEDRLWMQF